VQDALGQVQLQLLYKEHHGRPSVQGALGQVGQVFSVQGALGQMGQVLQLL